MLKKEEKKTAVRETEQQHTKENDVIETAFNSTRGSLAATLKKARLLKNSQAVETLIEVWHAVFASLKESTYEEGDTRTNTNTKPNKHKKNQKKSISYILC